MIYKKYDDFIKNPSFDYFSINPEDFKLCIAVKGESVSYYAADGTTPISEMGHSEGTTVRELDYQTILQNYALPFNFSVVLHVISQNVDFMEEFLDMAIKKNEENPIVLTFVESSSTTSEIKIYTGEEKETNEPSSDIGKIAKVFVGEGYEEQINKDGTTIINNSNIEKYYTPDEAYYKKATTVNTGQLYVTKADTWLKSTSKEISELQNPTTYSKGDKEKIVKDVVRQILYEYEDSRFILNTKSIIIKERLDTETNAKRYIVTDNDDEMNVDEFIELIKKYPQVESNLLSATYLTLDFLQQYENTQKAEKVMRYIFTYLTGDSYGVTTEEELKKLLDESLQTYNASRNLSTYLRQFSHSTEAPKSSDGKYYKMYGDGEGWPTIGNADIQWKSHEDEFNKNGKVLENGIEKEVNIQEYVNSKLPRGASAEYTNDEVESYQIYVEIELVDKIGDQIQKKYYNLVLNETSGLNLSRQQLYALTTIQYNWGYLPVSNERTFRTTYEEATGLYEINSWQHNMYIWDNWWAHIGGGAEGHIPARDAAFETYVKGVYDFSTSDAGEVFGRNYYIYYTLEQLNKFSYAPNKPITRTSANEEEIFTYEECAGKISGTINIDGYEYQLYTSSNGKTYTWYYQGYGPWSGYTSSSGSTMTAAGCYCTTSAIIGSGYGNKETPHWGRNIYEFEMIEENNLSKGCSDSGSYGVNLNSNQIKQIQEWLFNGGEVIIHVGNNSKYTSNQHWMPIVDISDDGQEVYIMNTVQSFEGWNNINDLAICVDCYYRVNGLK